MVDWDDVCRPREEKGLGFGNLVFKNQSLQSKWLRFPLERDSFWQ